ncbi:hypothetical protein, partial [Acinetobacter pittii]|uniref:hypothetical protein n=1 Tax=Acinetobacter pittii TaxID=48296 RepID=UPI001BC87948
MKHQSIHKHAKQLDLVKCLAKMNKIRFNQPICKDLENATYHTVNKTKQVSIPVVLATIARVNHLIPSRT